MAKLFFENGSNNSMLEIEIDIKELGGDFDNGFLYTKIMGEA